MTRFDSMMICALALVTFGGGASARSYSLEEAASADVHRRAYLEALEVAEAEPPEIFSVAVGEPQLLPVRGTLLYAEPLEHGEVYAGRAGVMYAPDRDYAGVEELAITVLDGDAVRTHVMQVVVGDAAEMPLLLASEDAGERGGAGELVATTITERDGDQISGKLDYSGQTWRVPAGATVHVTADLRLKARDIQIAGRLVVQRGHHASIELECERRGDITGAVIASDGAAGRDLGQRSTNGRAGGSVSIKCPDLRISALVQAGDGGAGGDASRVTANAMGTAKSGRGGRGGSVTLKAKTLLQFVGAPRISAGAGGAGGLADIETLSNARPSKATATVGAGVRGGRIVLSVDRGGRMAGNPELRAGKGGGTGAGVAKSRYEAEATTDKGGDGGHIYFNNALAIGQIHAGRGGDSEHPDRTYGAFAKGTELALATVRPGGAGGKVFVSGNVQPRRTGAAGRHGQAYAENRFGVTTVKTGASRIATAPRP